MQGEAVLRRARKLFSHSTILSHNDWGV